ncbi:MAG: hypothetical protein HUK20_04565 [Fibrobacter sp.]|nr:hypothetical protein [Fibrobacter sp.]
MNKILLSVLATVWATPFAATHVACVGNSITEGYGLNGATSYPQHLQRILGDEYTVANYGVSGKMFRRESNESYWSMDKFTQALSSNPNIVVIELGTNDSKFFMNNYPEQGIYNYYYNPEEHPKDAFYNDYEALIDTFANGQNAPEIYATLQPYSNNAGWFIMDSAIVNQINPIIKETAIKKGVHLIDLHKHFKTPEWFLADSVHPNATGAEELAKIIGNYICKGQPTLVQSGNMLKVDGMNPKWYKDGVLLNDENQTILEMKEFGKYKASVQLLNGDDSRLVSEELSVTSFDVKGVPKSPFINQCKSEPVVTPTSSSSPLIQDDYSYSATTDAIASKFATPHGAISDEQVFRIMGSEVSFHLNTSATVRLDIFDLQGRQLGHLKIHGMAGRNQIKLPHHLGSSNQGGFIRVQTINF